MSTRDCPLFDEFSKEFFALPSTTNLEAWEARCIEVPQVRRSSVEISEKLFLKALNQIREAHLFEVGGNIGRHTKLFLEQKISTLHTFEPNVELFPSFFEIETSEKFRFNPFGLSDTNGVTQFNIVDEVASIRRGATHGMGSFEDVGPRYERIYGSAKTKPISACHVRGDSYLDAISFDADEPLALWVDVEGHAKPVIDGFGDKLSLVKLAIVELETDDRYISRPNVDEVFLLMKTHGLQPVWRDIQYYGRFNVIFVNQDVVCDFPALLEANASKFLRNIHAMDLV